jgi:uncharacterized repeat protein (TIGR01451 family)
MAGAAEEQERHEQDPSRRPSSARHLRSLIGKLQHYPTAVSDWHNRDQLTSRGDGVALRTGGTVVAAMALALLGAAPASAQQPPGPNGQGTDFFVTIAARQCPTYEDITANRARNNIQESLRDLGEDTPYAAGQVVDLDTEERVHPRCSPLPDWRFTIGNAIAPTRVSGVWGSLSVVSGVDGTATTVDSVPRRNNIGEIISTQSVAGATTIELTPAQRDRAPRGNLWIQGGTPTDPMLFEDFRDEFGFGALRCATDNVNGDNVEFIAFPNGSRHVYCFAYYVTPPPTSGTIVIRKRVSEPANADQRFTFEGNISFTPDRLFHLNVVNGSTPSHTFYRAETGPMDERWTVREHVPDGWVLTDVTCDSTTSDVQVDRAGASVSISLVAGDTVTCTFTDAFRPPPSVLLLSKVTFGAVGTFGYTVRSDEDDLVASTSATTTIQGEPAAAESGPIELAPGDYEATEHLPRARGGEWRATAYNCEAFRNPTDLPPGARPRPVSVTITDTEGQACVFENRFVPSGAIRITKVTRGSTGTTGFLITPVADPARQFLQTATTTAENEPARARGDSTRRLRLGRYVIQEIGTTPGRDGRWTLVAVVCDGRLRGFAQGNVTIALTRRNPRVNCRFVDVFTPDARPLPPTPDPQPESVPPGPQPNLVITKRAPTRRVDSGTIATFVIAVHNRGEAAAQQVVLADILARNGQLVSTHPSQGRCNDRQQLICWLGMLDAGEQATVRVRLRAMGGASRLNNQAAAGSATPEARLANNFDRVQVRVRPRAIGPPPVTG